MSTSAKTSTHQPLLSIADVATRLSVCRQTVYNWLYKEGLPSIKIRGIRRIHPDSLEKWLLEREEILG